MRAPAAAAFMVTLAATLALCWPLPLHLDTWHTITPFADSHVWVFHWLARHLGQGELPGWTAEAGYPVERAVRLIAWGPALVFLPLRALFGSLAAANLVQILSLPVTAAAAALALRRVAGACPWTAAGLAVCYALSPTLLSTYGIGEVSNTQGWIFPAFLILLQRGNKSWSDLIGLAGVSLLSVFSSPYFGLALPLIAGGWAVLGWRSGEPPRRLAAALLAVAIGLAPAGPYYTADRAGGGESLFRPAQQSTMGQDLPHPSPVARPDALVWARERPPLSPMEPVHLSYLGLPMVITALILGWRGRDRPAVRAGAALALGGVILSLGPYLAWNDALVRLGGRPLLLPVWLLEKLHYPTRMGGMYFRYAVLAELGLCLMVAGGLAGSRRTACAAWLLAALHVGDSVRATGPLWPRPAEPVADLAELEAISGEDGAVLELPLQGGTDAGLGQAALLRAVFHQRPTSALPRDVLSGGSMFRGLLEQAKQNPTSLADSLHQQGFRYVLLPAALQGALREDRAITSALGEPEHSGGLLIWDLGPTTLAPRRLETGYRDRPQRE